MKIGSLFKYRHNGKHHDVTLIILHDKNKNERILFNIDYEIKVGIWILLYAEFTGKIANSQDIKKYLDLLNKEKKDGV